MNREILEEMVRYYNYHTKLEDSLFNRVMNCKNNKKKKKTNEELTQIIRVIDKSIKDIKKLSPLDYRHKLAIAILKEQKESLLNKGVI